MTEREPLNARVGKATRNEIKNRLHAIPRTLRIELGATDVQELPDGYTFKFQGCECSITFKAEKK